MLQAWNEPEVYETSSTSEGHQAELEAVRLCWGCATGQGRARAAIWEHNQQAPQEERPPCPPVCPPPIFTHMYPPMCSPMFPTLICSHHIPPHPHFPPDCTPQSTGTCRGVGVAVGVGGCGAWGGVRSMGTRSRGLGTSGVSIRAEESLGSWSVEGQGIARVCVGRGTM